MERIYALAEEYQVPILMHFQYETFNTGFDRFGNVLKKWPKVTFIGHAMMFWANIDAVVKAIHAVHARAFMYVNLFWFPTDRVYEGIDMAHHSCRHFARCLGIWILLNCSDHSLAVDSATASVFLRPPKLPYVRSELATGQNHATLLHVTLLSRSAGRSSVHLLGSTSEEALACDV